MKFKLDFKREEVNRERLQEILACPECLSSIEIREDNVLCIGCQKEYPIINGVPIMFHSQSEVVKEHGEEYFLKRDSNEEKIQRKFSINNMPFIKRLMEVPVLANSIRGKRTEWEEQCFEKCGVNSFDTNEIILNLGSGVQVEHEKGRFLNFDIAPHANADVVGDGHFLPFQNNSLSGVCMISILEHVPEPIKIVSEVHRVLKDRGFVFAYAPFIFPYHEAPGDYFRYTNTGLRQLFHEFDEIDCFSDQCPTRALIIAISEYFSIFSNNKVISYALKLISAWLLNPFKYVDYYLYKKKKSMNLVTGFTFLGRKNNKRKI